MDNSNRVIIVPCSGIGKSFGTVSRIAAYQVTEDDRPENTQLIPLALVVLGDEEASKALENNPAITIDGCQLACATKMVRESGGKVAREIAVLDLYKRNRDLRPQGISQLNEGGLKLAVVLAEEIDLIVDELTQGGNENA